MGSDGAKLVKEAILCIFDGFWDWGSEGRVVVVSDIVGVIESILKTEI